MVMAKSKIITILGIVFAITLFFLAILFVVFRIQTNEILRIYDAKGLLLAKCDFKDGTPWNGTFIEDKTGIEHSNYCLDYYVNGKIDRSLYFISGEPVIGMMERRGETGAYLIKIKNGIKNENASIVALFDSCDQPIISTEVKENSFALLAEVLPGTYSIKIKTTSSQWENKYRFVIKESGSIHIF
jgi:hypothetical protein